MTHEADHRRLVRDCTGHRCIDKLLSLSSQLEAHLVWSTGQWLRRGGGKAGGVPLVLVQGAIWLRVAELAGVEAGAITTDEFGARTIATLELVRVAVRHSIAAP